MSKRVYPIAVVHRNIELATRVVQSLGISATPLAFGSQIRGSMFRRVVIIADPLNLPSPRREFAQRWIDELLVTCITSDGDIINAY